MPKVVSVEQMRQIERAADSAGHSYAQMMEHAGWSVAQVIVEQFAPVEGKQVLVLAGSGNNGGDGLVAAEHLAQAGMHVSVYLTKQRAADDPHLGKLRDRGTLIAIADQDQRSRVLRLQVGRAQLIVDAILGTGFELPLQGAAQEVLKVVQNSLGQRADRPVIVAVDCPSGLDCDSGAVAEETIPADLTVTLAAAKPGLLRFPGAGFTGRLVVADIGLPSDQAQLANIEVELASPIEVRPLLPGRPRDAHKGTFGRALIIAGSANYPGAALLAARSAYLVGAGLVSLAVPAPLQPMIAGELPEATWILLPEKSGAITPDALGQLEPEWTRSQAVLVGPGLGLESATGAFIAELFGRRLKSEERSGASAQALPGRSLPPCVVDADGLKHLSALAGWPEAVPEGTILTPHPGEMSLLTGSSKEAIQAERLDAARRSAREWGHIVVLKGAHTVIAEPAGRATILPFATPALARAGTGDVLAGVIVGLRAQGVPAFSAAVLGGYLHGRAGELAAATLGTTASVLASDVAAAIPQALAELQAS
ncbi:MAG TPA: NAD(P)H-hydrate dehydratase [Anaerolineales bacterium]|nr:NAD(P)H-hydrate dehydratase [Anaerolineales bacterium]